VETIIANQVSLSVARNVVRTEKLFIEDQVFESDTDVLKITQSKDYRAMIYMPKRDVTFNWFYVKAFRINSNYFKVYIQNGSAEPELLEYEFVEEEQYFYQSKTNLNWQVSAFDYDPQNPINGSLAELGKSQETLGLLTQAKDKDGNPIENVYTYANVGMQIKFVSDTPFMFAEAETQVK